jgi:hypothetical protein
MYLFPYYLVGLFNAYQAMNSLHLWEQTFSRVEVDANTLTAAAVRLRSQNSSKFRRVALVTQISELHAKPTL